MTLNLGDSKVKELYYGNTKVSGGDNYEVIKTLYEGSGASGTINYDFSKINKGILVTVSSTVNVVVGKATLKIDVSDFFGPNKDNKVLIPVPLLKLGKCTISGLILNAGMKYDDYFKRPFKVLNDSTIKYLVPTDSSNTHEPLERPIEITDVSAGSISIETNVGNWMRSWTTLDSEMNKISSESNDTTTSFDEPKIIKIELV